MTDYDGDISYYHIPKEWYEWFVSCAGIHTEPVSVPQTIMQAYFEYCGEEFPEKWDITHIASAAEDYHCGSKAADLIATVPPGSEIVEIKGEWY